MHVYPSMPSPTKSWHSIIPLPCWPIVSFFHNLIVHMATRPVYHVYMDAFSRMDRYTSSPPCHASRPAAPRTSWYTAATWGVHRSCFQFKPLCICLHLRIFGSCSCMCARIHVHTFQCTTTSWLVTRSFIVMSMQLHNHIYIYIYIYARKCILMPCLSWIFVACVCVCRCVCVSV